MGLRELALEPACGALVTGAGRLSLLLAGGGGVTIRQLAALAAEAEHNGFDGVYTVEAWRSGPPVLAAIALATERLRLGPYVLNAHARTPLFTGITAVDLDELSSGRLVLAIGSGNRIMNERYQGVPVERPLEKMRDYLDVVRAVVTARTGDVVDAGGARHRTCGWQPQVDPVRGTIPVHLAAMSPKMLDLASVAADGVALGSLLSPSELRRLTDRCRDVAPPSFEVRASVLVCVDPDPERARAAATRSVVNLYVGKPHPHYDALLRRQGYAKVAEAIARDVAAGDIAAACRSVPEELVSQLTVAGDAAYVRSRLEAMLDIVDEVVVLDVGTLAFEGQQRHENRAEQLVESTRCLVAALERQHEDDA